MKIKKRKETFVLIVPRFEDIFHSYYSGEIIRGVSLSASRLNADFLIHITDRTDHRGWLDSSLLDPQFISGILFADIDNDLDVVKKAIQHSIPTLVLNNMIDGPFNYVAVDNYKAAFQAVQYLINSGHTNIATIAGDVSTQSGLQRLEGFRAAMHKNHLTVPKANITFGEYLRTPARLGAQKILKLKNRPTAIFAGSDVMALELMDVARSMDIKVPEELSVIGFDDNPLSSVSTLPLTTVSQPLVEMGRLGAEQLGLIARGKSKLPVKLMLPTKLIKRKTVKEIK